LKNVYIYDIFVCTYILYVKPWSVPVDTHCETMQGTNFWSRRQNKIFTSVGPKCVTTASDYSISPELEKLETCSCDWSSPHYRLHDESWLLKKRSTTRDTQHINVGIGRTLSSQARPIYYSLNVRVQLPHLILVNFMMLITFAFQQY
jgi:hypothetical protein